MEKDNSSRHQGQSSTNTQKSRRHAGGESREDQNVGEPEEWKALERNFHRVQSVLDRNRALIEQVNANHQSRTHRNLVENVSLIQEINGNISQVVSLYSGFSADFTQAFRQHEAANGDQNGPDKARD